MTSEHHPHLHAAMERFTKALNAVFTGDFGPMVDVWSHEDDVTYLGSDGSVRAGWPEVLDDWEAQAALQLGGEVESTNVRVVAGTDLATVTSEVVGHNTDASGTPQAVRIRSTNTFRKEDGEWKMIGTHTDQLPIVDD